MRLISYTLRGFTVFKFFKIESLSIRYSEDIQIILGTNGSGKSSYLRTLTPYPLSRSMFKDDANGYREMVLEHNGHVYTLISDYSNKTSPHQFIRDDLGNMNDGGTTNVQCELVESELGLNREREKLLFGDIAFCTMSPGQVKPFLMKICPLDLSWILEKQKKTSSALRNIKAELKYLSQRETQLLSELSSEEELAKMRKDKETYKTQIANLIASQARLKTLLDSKTKEISTIEKSIAELSPVPLSEIIATQRTLSTEIKSLWDPAWDTLLKDIPPTQYEVVLSKKDMLEADLVKYATRLREIEQSLEKSDDESLEKLSAELISNQSKKESLEKHILSHPFSPEDLRSLKIYSPEFEMILEHISSINDNRKIWSQAHYYRKSRIYHHNSMKMSRWVELKQGLESTIAQLNKELNSAWSPTIHPCAKEKCLFYVLATSKRNERLDQLKASEAKLAFINQRIEKYSGYIEARQNDLALRGKLNQCLDRLKTLGTQECPPLMRILQKRDFLQTLSENPYALHRELEELIRCSHATHSYNALSERIRECERHIQTLNKVSGSYKDYLIKDKESITKSITTLEETYKTVEEQSKAISVYKKIETTNKEIDRLKSLSTKIIESHAQIAGINAVMDVHRNELIQTEANLSKSMDILTQIENVLSSQEKILSRYEEEVKSRKTDLETRFKHYSDLEYAQIELPKKYMNEWLTSLVEQVNRFIGVIWNQPFELVIPKDENDYKFTAKFRGETIDDLRLCSSAQQDIINLCVCLALRSPIASTDGIGMVGYPLALDETGRTFDEAHKRNLIDLFNLLIQEGLVSQIYLTSHHTVIHGALANIQTLVLNADNIALPADYNQDVELVYM